jgi:starch synthase
LNKNRTSLHVVMVAAENDALPGFKVGGIGDVLRDLPPALAALGCAVTVVNPAYGLRDELPSAQHIGTLDAVFRGAVHPVGLYEAKPDGAVPGVRNIVLDHAAFSVCGRGKVYCDDPPEQPFATDASKFALFAAAVAEALKQQSFGVVDVVHLHDWHAALLLVLRRYERNYRCLQDLRCVYTLHNLSLQGVRPLRGDPSALESWFPALRYVTAEVADPRWTDCINLMAVGIRLADAVHTVSPSYAAEILLPSAVATDAYHGGEGLEADLNAAQAGGRLHGFLNGCEYPEDTPPAPAWPELLDLMRTENLRFAAAKPELGSANFIAHTRLAELSANRPADLLTSVGRITAQKVRLLQTITRNGQSALDGILEVLGDDGLFVILGNGDPGLEQFLAATSARRRNLVFLCGYSAALSDALYGAGDLFVMPSSFEPCGISQMLAMRAGQPCLVHQVGGLRDTVTPGVDGFGFTADTLLDQADALVATAGEALALRRSHPRRWKKLCQAAASARFPWRDAAAACLRQLYSRTTA